jgi:hypothetical protein
MTDVDEKNPYAPPETWDIEGDRRRADLNIAWQDGKALMVRKGATLPDRCLKCNAPAEGFEFKRTLYWIDSWWVLSVLVVGPVLFAIIYLIVRKQGKVSAGLCPRHRRRRGRFIAICSLVALAGTAAFIGGIVVSDYRTPVAFGIAARDLTPFLIAGGLLMLFIAAIVGSLGARVLVPKKIDKDFIWLSHVSPEYLATFPTLMG